MATFYSFNPSRAVTDESAGVRPFALVRSGDLVAETVFVSTVVGTANGFSDNNADISVITDMAVTFAVGQTTMDLEIPLVHDNLVEFDERFALVAQRSASDPASTFLARATFTIYNDDFNDAHPQLSVKNTVWQGGSGNWADLSSSGAGWGPIAPSTIPSVPNAAVFADIPPDPDRVVTVSAGSYAARALRMNDVIVSLADAGTLKMTGGSLTLSTTSLIGSLVQTGGTLAFRNGVVRPDNSIDFSHPDSPGALSYIGRTVTQGAGGTIDIQSGTLVLSAHGENGQKTSLAGTVKGAGKLQIDNDTTLAHEPNATLQPGVKLDVASFTIGSTGTHVLLNTDLTYAGNFAEGPQATLQLNGHSFTLAGQSAFQGEYDGGGKAGSTVLVKHASEAGGIRLLNGVVFDVANTVTLNQNFFGTSEVSAGSTLKIGAAGRWNFVDDLQQANLAAGGTMTNAGTIEKLYGPGTNAIGGSGNFVSTGTIKADKGTVAITASTSTLGGHLTGAGTITIGGDNTAVTLAAGANLDVAALSFGGASAVLKLGGSLGYGGAFTGGSGGFNSSTIDLNGFTFTLEGAATLASVHLTGAGTLAVKGAATANGLSVDGGAVLDDQGTITAAADAAVSAGSQLKIGSGGKWLLAADNRAIVVQSGGTVNNAGFLEKTQGTGTAFVRGAGVFNSTGTIKVDAGALAIQEGSGTLGGHLTGAGTLSVGGGYTLAASTVIDVAALTLGGAGPKLGGDLSYAGAFTASVGTALDLDGHTLNLKGKSTLSLQVQGGGTMRIDGAAAADAISLENGSDLDGRGTVTNTGRIGVNADSALTIRSGATWNIAGDNQFAVEASGKITNAGIFEKTAGTGFSTVSGGIFVNTGKVVGDSGTLDFSSTLDLANKGTIEAADGTVSFRGSFDFETQTYRLKLANDGLIEADGGTVSFQDVAVTGKGTAKIADGGMLVTDDSFQQNIAFDGKGRLSFTSATGGYHGKISGFAAGDSIDFTRFARADVAGFTYDGKTLALKLKNSATPLTFALTGSVSASDLHLADDGQGGTSITAVAPTVKTLTTGKDVFTFKAGTNVVKGTAKTLDPADRLTGGSGTDTLALAGGGTFDLAKLALFKGFEKVTLDDHASTVVLGAGTHLTVLGGSASDRLTSGSGVDTLDGGGGNDTLKGGGKGDTLIGGAGTDTASYSGAKKGVTASLAKAGSNTNDAKGDSYDSIENLTGSSHADTLTGNDKANKLSGGSGNDTLNGGKGGDTLEGGKGTDTASYAGASKGVTANLSKASANTGDAKGDSFSSIENLSGSSHDDRLTGNGKDNILAGGAGKDTLTGGNGEDTFLFDSKLGSKNADTVSDFDHGDDRFKLDRDVFKDLAKGTLSSDAFHLGTTAADKQDRIIYDKKHGDLYFDRDGTKTKYDAVKFASVDDGIRIDHTDFFVA